MTNNVIENNIQSSDLVMIELVIFKELMTNSK